VTANRAIPIFAFHRVGPRADCRFTVPTDIFAQYLAVIADEGYSTLTCSDLVSVVEGRAEPPARSCLLTFDDGYADIWTYAVPLLKRRHMRGTVFVVLNRLEGRGTPRPTLEDVWCRRCGIQELYQLPPMPRINARSLDPAYTPSTDHISVEEARAIADLGVCDVQSHGLDHMVHYSSSRLAGFLRPDSHWTALAAARGDCRLGTPIYETSSVLVKPSYRDPRPIRDRLAQVVADAGGAPFFDRTGWADVLRNEFDATVTRTGAGQVEPEASWRTSVSAGLQKCIRQLSEQTGSRVQALAWPFGSNSERSREIALHSGFAVAFTSRAGGYVAGVPQAGIGRISLKDHDPAKFRLALLRHSDPDYVQQQSAGAPDEGPLAIAV
jgi:peptidoglycan/xylan/chitin deacetylase (PgdA/CDA1 family)